jgi:hypothetical protein
MDNPPEVRAAVERLVATGLDRHDVLHAIGSVLAEFLQDTMQSKPGDQPPLSAYRSALKALTPEKLHDA